MRAPVSRASALSAWIVTIILMGLAATALIYGGTRLRATSAIQASFAADPSCRPPAPASRPRAGACRLVPGRIVGAVDPSSTGRHCPCAAATIALPDGRESHEYFHGKIAVAVRQGIAPVALLFHDRDVDYYAGDDVEPTNDDPEEAVMSDQGLVAWGALMVLIFVVPLAIRAATLRRNQTRSRRRGFRP